MFKAFVPIGLSLWLGLSATGQTNTDQNSPSDQQPAQQEKQKPGIVREIGAGAGAAGDGIARGAGAVAKGTAKGASELVTWHPVEAIGSAGKGAAVGAKDVTVGAAKGAGKAAAGIGRAFRDLF